jgi:hypothetical protein
MDNLKHVRQQGRDAKKANDDNRDDKGNVIDTSKTIFTEHDCPYGPGDTRDAWLAGFGGQEEPQEQADTSKPTTQDVRTDAQPETVREGAKPKRGAKKGAAAKTDAEPTKTVVETTGNAETSLVTKVVPVDPQASDRVPTPETVIGDPAASQGPNDGNVQHADDATGRTDGAPEGTKATGQEVKPESLM